MERLAKVGWALATLSFGMGVWATALQGRVSILESNIADFKSNMAEFKKDRDISQAEWRTWRESMTGKQASIDAKLDIVISQRIPMSQSPR